MERFDDKIEVLADIYAVPDSPFAARRDAIRRATKRAVAVRIDGTPPPGEWHGVMAPRRDGRINFVPGDPPFDREGARRLRAGGNGPSPVRIRAGGNGPSPARDAAQVIRFEGNRS